MYELLNGYICPTANYIIIIIIIIKNNFSGWGIGPPTNNITQCCMQAAYVDAKGLISQSHNCHFILPAHLSLFTILEGAFANQTREHMVVLEHLMRNQLF